MLPKLNIRNIAEGQIPMDIGPLVICPTPLVGGESEDFAQEFFFIRRQLVKSGTEMVEILCSQYLDSNAASTITSNHMDHN